MACCGRKAGAQVEYQATANNGTVKKFNDSASARLFLAGNGGGSVKAVPKNAPKG